MLGVKRSVKRSVVFASAIALVSLASAAPLAGQGSIGLRGGVNLTSFIGLDAPEDEKKLGLNLGLSFQLINIGPLTIAPEVYYVQKGSIQQILAPGADPALQGTEAEFTLAYIEMPVLAIVHLGSGPIRPYLEGGPAFAWNLNCTIGVSGSSQSLSNECDALLEQNLQSTLRDYELGFVVGVGTDIRVSQLGAVTLDARLTQGLSRLTEGTEISNQAFTLMLGYSFGF